MSAYYNEIEPYAAQWLRNLIAVGYLPPGEVDERDVRTVQPDDVREFTQCHFFAGIGGWPLALRLAGWSDDRAVWTGSCPCQPFSTAGRRGGVADERHLWPVWFRLVAECRSPVVFGEQVASPDGLAWLDAVHADLEGAGYAVGAVDLCAAGVGAPHIRQRLWFVADAAEPRRHEQPQRPDLADGRQEAQSRRLCDAGWATAELLDCLDGKKRPTQPGLHPLAHGLSGRVGRLRAYGNAIVPQVAEQVIMAYMECRP